MDPDKWALSPPTAQQQGILQQVLTAGLVDQVARKIPSSVVREVPALRGAYRSCSLDEPLWLHPSSALFKQQPELIVYQEVVVGVKAISGKTKATMRGVTKVPVDRLHDLGANMCTFSAPLDTMPKWYDAERHRLMCYVTPSYGQHRWQLEAAQVPLPQDDKERYSLFARLLLQGDLVPKLKAFVDFLRAKPTTVEAKSAQLRTIAMVQSLKQHAIDTVPKLTKKWSSDPQFLLEPYLKWVTSSHHPQLRKIWPPTE